MSIPKLGYRPISLSKTKGSKRPIRQAHYASGFNFSYNLPKTKFGVTLYHLKQSIKSFLKLK